MAEVVHPESAYVTTGASDKTAPVRSHVAYAERHCGGRKVTQNTTTWCLLGAEQAASNRFSPISPNRIPFYGITKYPKMHLFGIEP